MVGWEGRGAAEDLDEDGRQHQDVQASNVQTERAGHRGQVGSDWWTHNTDLSLAAASGTMTASSCS